jgi:GGDEF domain-containing protein
LGLFKYVKGLLGGDARKRQAEPRAASGAGAQRASLADFEDRLRAAIRIAGKVSAGQVKFLGLSQIRDHFGPRWERVSEAVEANVRSVIDRRLANFEVCAKVGELQYVMVFPTLDETAARIRCAAIIDEITKRLLGDKLFESGVDIESTVAVLDRRSADPKADIMGTLRERLDQDARQQNERRAAGLPTGLQAYARPIDNGPGYGDEPPTADDNDRPDRSGGRNYRPMWDVGRGVISTFLYAGEEAAAASRLGDAADLAECDRWALSEVSRDLARIVEAGRKLLLTVPVHYSTLSVGVQRRLYLPLCRALTPAMVGLLVFEVVDLPEGIPHGRLVELTALLKPFARALILRLPLQNKLIKMAAEARLFAVGVDLSTQTVSEAETVEALLRFIQSANASRLQTYALGVGSVSLASAAIGGGIDYLNGEIVTDPLSELPESIYRFGIRNLYRGDRR